MKQAIRVKRAAVPLPRVAADHAAGVAVAAVDHAVAVDHGAVAAAADAEEDAEQGNRRLMKRAED